MGNLSRNFSRHEFQCKGANCCGNSSPMDSRLIESLQLLRDMAGSPLFVSSGFRCRTHNGSIQGASPKSQHTFGTAADIRSMIYTPRDLAEMAKMIDAFRNGGLGLYIGHLHVDVRGFRARWGRF